MTGRVVKPRYIDQESPHKDEMMNIKILNHRYSNRKEKRQFKHLSGCKTFVERSDLPDVDLSNFMLKHQFEQDLSSDSVGENTRFWQRSCTVQTKPRPPSLFHTDENMVKVRKRMGLFDRNSYDHVKNHLPADKKNEISKFKYFEEDFWHDPDTNYDLKDLETHKETFEKAIGGKIKVEKIQPDDDENIDDEDKSDIRLDADEDELLRTIDPDKFDFDE